MTSVPPLAPRSVAVCGSCITRDNFNAKFNPEHRRWYDVTAQSNQSSMIALMSPPVTAEVSTADGLTDYDVWNVRSDLGREFLTDVVEAQPAYLILDFFGDLHFGVRELRDGRYVTDNGWKLHQTAQYAAWTAAGEARVVRKALDDPETYFALWTEAIGRFAAFIAEKCPSTTVIVHRGFYAGRVVTGPTGRPQGLAKFANLPRLKVRQINDFWARLDSYAIDTFGWRAIDLRGERYTSTSEHPWGAFWVHYTLDYYPRFLAELHLIDLETRMTPEIGEQVALIGEAGRTRINTQAEFLRSAISDEQHQIDALEARGVLRSAFARKKVVR